MIIVPFICHPTMCSVSVNNKKYDERRTSRRRKVKEENNEFNKQQLRTLVLQVRVHALPSSHQGQVPPPHELTKKLLLSEISASQKLGPKVRCSARPPYYIPYQCIKHSTTAQQYISQYQYSSCYRRQARKINKWNSQLMRLEYFYKLNRPRSIRLLDEHCFMLHTICVSYPGISVFPLALHT